jgi:predicted glycosyltransferase
VTGQNLADGTFAALQQSVASGCTLIRHHPDLPTLVGQAAVSVSQAGYNTVVEGLQARARMVLVPFAAGASRAVARARSGRDVA